jgi:hypothetical protein
MLAAGLPCAARPCRSGAGLPQLLPLRLLLLRLLLLRLLLLRLLSSWNSVQLHWRAHPAVMRRHHTIWRDYAAGRTIQKETALQRRGRRGKKNAPGRRRAAASGGVACGEAPARLQAIDWHDRSPSSSMQLNVPKLLMGKSRAAGRRRRTRPPCFVQDARDGGL